MVTVELSSLRTVYCEHHTYDHDDVGIIVTTYLVLIAFPGLKYSIFQDNLQIAAFAKNRVVIGRMKNGPVCSRGFVRLKIAVLFWPEMKK